MEETGDKAVSWLDHREQFGARCLAWGHMQTSRWVWNPQPTYVTMQIVSPSKTNTKTKNIWIKSNKIFTERNRKVNEPHFYKSVKVSVQDNGTGLQWTKDRIFLAGRKKWLLSKLETQTIEQDKPLFLLSLLGKHVSVSRMRCLALSVCLTVILSNCV